MSQEWEQYRTRYLSTRPETYEAYVDVWTSDESVRRRFSGWATFSQCANAEPAKRREMPHLVAEAEDAMVRNGYEIGQPTSRGGRRWKRSTGQRRRRPAES